MKKFFLWSIAVVALCGFAALFFWPRQKNEPPKAQTAASEPAAKPAVRYPVERDQSGPPLPTLAESDDALAAGLLELFGQKPPEFIYLKDIVRRVVATVDKLPRDHAAPQLLPVKTLAGFPATEKIEGNLVLSPRNAARYHIYVGAAELVPADQLVALYARFYPLFQEQYENLGYPGKHFNDRVVEVIDHLLATPDAPEPLRIVQPRVLYEFADAKLESLSAGQKILLRVGKANRDKLKSKLQQLREAVTHLDTVE
jgi:hypothetical protein